MADAGGQIYYHGGNRTDELFYHDEIWLTDEPWYAYLYASEKNRSLAFGKSESMRTA